MAGPGSGRVSVLDTASHSITGAHPSRVKSSFSGWHLAFRCCPGRLHQVPFLSLISGLWLSPGAESQLTALLPASLIPSSGLWRKPRPPHSHLAVMAGQGKCTPIPPPTCVRAEAGLPDRACITQRSTSVPRLPEGNCCLLLHKLVSGNPSALPPPLRITDVCDSVSGTHPCTESSSGAPLFSGHQGLLQAPDFTARLPISLMGTGQLEHKGTGHEAVFIP